MLDSLTSFGTDKVDTPKPGGRASSLYAVVGMADTPNQAALAATYVKQLKDEVATVLGSTIGATLSPLQYSQDFNWSWTTGAGDVNALTYNYISGAVTPTATDATIFQVGGASSFSMLYQQLINGIVWQFSAADKATLQQAMTSSQTQATSVVQSYVSAYGAPTPAQIATAQAVNPVIQTALDYVLLYQAGYLWAGSPKPGLSLYVMQRAQNLSALLQYAPPSAQPTIQALTAYLNALGPAAQLMDAQSQGAFTLQQIKYNLTPSATNGGILLSNPPSTAYYLGFGSNSPPAQILANLQNTGQQATVSFSASASSSSSYNVSFSGQAGFDWEGDLLGVSVGTSFQGDVARQQGCGSTMNVTMVYQGLTVIPFTPAALQQPSSGTTGWWYEPIIYQALQNFEAGANAQTGYTFGNAIPGGMTLGEGGVGYLSAVVVSQYPTITIEFSEGSYDDFSSWLSTHTTMSVSLFGFIPLGSASVDTYTASASHSSSGSGFTLTLSPPLAGSGGTIPAPLQTVPVLAGQIFWAGATTS